ncbi:MAG: DUF1800 domain-containing protein [Acidobacteria bacterium]|nr:DUF1800 domain-containing protein [Acidobacteriota bacterium]
MLRRTVALLVLPALFAANPVGFQRKLSKGARIEHALNRLTFGATDADRAMISQLGVEKWIDLQLHPQPLPENPALLARLAKLDSLPMTAAQIADKYPPPNVLRQLVRSGNFDQIKDPVMRARLERYAERLKEKKDQNAEPNAAVLTPEEAKAFRQATPEERKALLAKLDPAKRDAVLARLPAGRPEIMNGNDLAMRREMIAAQQPNQVVYHDLTDAKMMRAVQSTHQVEEILADFWFNHFNVFYDKGINRLLTSSYERDAIRPHVLGNFKDLLLATSQHPSMLFYLDNWTSMSAEAAQRGRGKKKAQGLNENYARELLELHTMGVDNGYTQKDVTEVARCFTGWSMTAPKMGGGFVFNARNHDRGEKIVLGHRIAAGGGKEDGLRVIDILMEHPSTARFIARKLAQRFVADEPPPALVERMAKSFTKTKGEIAPMLALLFASPEFWSEGAYKAKMKMPFEMVASALRATNARVDSTVALTQQLATLGQPLYKKVEPTGYYATAEEWTNSAALLARMNFAMALTSNKVPGVKVAIAPSEARAKGLALGGPEFQRH